jgi:3-oxosteroid 1-dehydrogenase
MSAVMGVHSCDRWDREVDLLVFGSGAAGLCAALVGANEGLDVLLCEKSPQVGGTTATSGGTVWIPGTRQSQSTPTPDLIERARLYLDGEIGRDGSPEMREQFLQTGPQAIDYLHKHTEVLFKVNSPYPDYHAENPGGALGGRALSPLAFDARLLGKDFKLVRPPMSEFMVLGGMMVARDEIKYLIRPWHSWQALTKSAQIVGRYVLDCLQLRPRGTRLLLGNALVGRFLYSLRIKGGEIALNAGLKELLQDERGQVVGAEVGIKGQTVRIRARRGVVLATGGPAASAQWRKRLMPERELSYSLAFSANTGDGLEAAQRVGAEVDLTGTNPFFWMPASTMRRKDGSTAVFPHLRDRPKPGLIAVRPDGHRFVNEANSYHDFVSALFKAEPSLPKPYAYLVCDQRFIHEYGLGLIHPVWHKLSSFIQKGYLFRGDTLEQLAQNINVDAQALMESVRVHNQDALKGQDRAFGKGSLALNQFNGDPLVQPNPCLHPIGQAPYFAVKVHPVPIGSSVGLRTNIHGQVLNHSGSAISGLYACGNDMSSIMRGHYPGPGITLGPGIVFGYLVARHAARQSGSDCEVTNRECA